MDMMSLPTDVIENILSFLSYDEISKNRIVSKAFNRICMGMLNQGFNMVERRHAQALENIKAQMPIRESQRRNHYLYCHFNILISMNIRMSRLKITYTKYIENEFCCFIPGKVIDEIRRVLIIVETVRTPLHEVEVLEALQALSNKAIGHFVSNISPVFERRLQNVQRQFRPQGPGPVPPALRQELDFIRRRLEHYTKEMSFLNSQAKLLSKQMQESKRKLIRQSIAIKKIAKAQKYHHAISARANIQPRESVIEPPSPSEADGEPPTKTPTLDDTLHFAPQHSRN